ncbi:MAG: hypothetical protein P8M22_00500 [Phycisphaerales bacterium]|nr:hypothetical protein [Phycisphaerales bacterium]
MLMKIVASIALVTTIAAVTTTTWSRENDEFDGIAKGGVLFNGTLLEAPFIVRFQDELLTINQAEIGKVETVDITSEQYSLDTIDGVIQQAYTIHDAIMKVSGKNTAIKSTINTLVASPLVDSAIVNGDAIDVQFKGEEFVEVLMFDFDNRNQDLELNQVNFLKERQQMIKYFLNEDRMVILQDGILVITEPGSAKSKVDELRSALSDGVDEQERRKQLLKIIPDQLVANRVAQTLKDNEEATR